MSGMIELQFLQALALTILIETACLIILLKYLPNNKKQYAKIKPQHILFAGVFTSMLTLPYVWFILPRFIQAPYDLLIIEAIVVVVEMFLLSYLLNLKIKTGLFLSLICNAASFVIGYILF
ncbi:MAG: hypothetical protein ABIG66_05700 [Candidatus Kerfeldbacteria bacterium]